LQDSITGYLLDAWSSGDQITLWVKEDSGRDHFFHDTYHIPIHIRALTPRGEAFFRKCIKESIYSEPTSVVRKDVWTGEDLNLYRVYILNSRSFRIIYAEAEKSSEDIEYFDTDILPVHRYFLEMDLYPLAKINIGYNLLGNLFIHVLSNRLKETKTTLPPFSAILLSTPRGRFTPMGKENPLEISFSESEKIVCNTNNSETLEILNKVLHDRDPDLIFTHSGDEQILPTLFAWSRTTNISLSLDRDSVRVIRKGEIRKKSFFSYGRAIAKTTPFPLFGRLHIDRGVSFFYLESELEGIFEMSRFSRLTLQKIARSSPGSAMSAMEDETALKMGYAIPRSKGQAPEIKSLGVLLSVDQGGLSFRPPVGVFENVVELDFRSLYPNLMRLHNISGETINCHCCRDFPRVVPATPYYTCRKRKGIVGETISLLLDRRDELKEILKNPDLTDEEKKAFSLRASALKWALVTSFGYTGYKHAKYGKREAHEAITAHGREALSVAKEIAEDNGYVFLHGLTDSLWLMGDTSPEKINHLTKCITERVGILILEEATYSYIVFPKSKLNEEISVATRYFARDINGGVKVRGMMIRKRDTPKFVKEFQENLLEIFSKISEVSEIHKSYDKFQSLLLEYENRLFKEKIEKEHLVIRKYISRPFEDYKQNNASKIILEQLKNENTDLIGGERIEYIAINTKDSDPSKRYINHHQYTGNFDKIFYRNLLRDAFYELLDSFFERENSLFR
jgi:DNA polymerase elongation subunit (family B)